jgi:outer membrane phospholipase A
MAQKLSHHIARAVAPPHLWLSSQRAASFSSVQAFLAASVGLFLPWLALAQEPTLVFTPPSQAVVAGENLVLFLNALNNSETNLAWSFPGRIAAHVVVPHWTNQPALELKFDAPDPAVSIAAGGFARRPYVVPIPPSFSNQVILSFGAPVGGSLILSVQTPQVAQALTEPSKSPFAKMIKNVPSKVPGRPFEPVGFFKDHIFPYEPFYFLAGTESPNAKFQVSIKYQIINRDGYLAQHAPGLTGFHIGYTQVSLWDWNHASAPFLDSSYKPELLYAWRLMGRDPTNRFRLDVQSGIQHESNGKDGVDSRSLNIIYLRPTVTFGEDEKFQLTLTPRAWIYIGDLSDNPDIEHFRGYADLRGTIAYKGLQLSALGRMGNTAERGSVQLDLTYPLTKLWGSFSVYLHAQYFTGYGESLLQYNERSSAFRAGFSLYR